MVDKVVARTGLTQPEIIRRSVRLLYLEIEKRGNAGFIIDELTVNPSASAARLNEQSPKKYGK